MFSVPLWLVAFVAAAVAPFAAGALQGAMERRSRRRTRGALARAGLEVTPPPEGLPRKRSENLNDVAGGDESASPSEAIAQRRCDD